MGFFNHDYPYTDNHELNLDWIINTVIDTVEQFSDVKLNFDELKTRFEALSQEFSTLNQAFEAFKVEVINIIATHADEIVVQRVAEYFNSSAFDQLLNNKVIGAVANKMISVIELQILGWTVPDTSTIKNTINNGIFTQNVGRIRLDLTWSYSTSGFFRTNTNAIPDIVTPSNAIPIKGYVYGYNIVSSNNLTSNNLNFAVQDTKRIVVKNDAFTDPTLFSASIKDTYLYYELETPINYIISDKDIISGMILKDVTTSVVVQANVWSADVFNLPTPSTTAIYNVANTSSGTFYTILKHANGNILSATQLPIGPYCVSGINK